VRYTHILDGGHDRGLRRHAGLAPGHPGLPAWPADAVRAA